MKEDDTANQENLIIYLEKLKYLSVLLPSYIPEKIQSFEKKVVVLSIYILKNSFLKNQISALHFLLFCKLLKL